MKYLSTFSGIGGFELGIQLAYESTMDNRRTTETPTLEERRNKPMPDNSNGDGRRSNPTCIGYSEIDKYASQIYQKHFPNHKPYGDITQIIAEELPDFDLLVGGFPCQAFSIAGKRGGFEDTRGTMFFELARILRAKQPRLFVFENVKGLLSHDGGKSFATIIQTLDELGYDLQWQVLNSKNHGVPQNRERVFIIGNLRGTPRPQVFPFGEDDGVLDKEDKSNKRRAQAEIASTLAAGGEMKADKSFVVEVVADLAGQKWSRFNESSRRIYGTDGISPTIPTVAGGGHTPKIDVSEIEDVLHSQGLEITEKGYESLDRAISLQDARIRRLTPTECERLQGFPDGWTEGGINEKGEDITISDTRRYQTLGNAVTVNVIRDIFLRLIPTSPI